VASEIDRHLPGATLQVPSSVLRELEKLASEEVAGSTAALELARRWPVVDAPGNADDAIVAAAQALRRPVVTADRELSERLRERGIDVYSPRDRHRLELHKGRAVGKRRRNDRSDRGTAPLPR